MTDSIDRSELKEAVREILSEILGGAINRSEYPASEAYLLLGYSNPRQLYDAVRSGLLRVGHEVQDRRNPNDTRPKYYFEIKKCRKRLTQPPEKRK